MSEAKKRKQGELNDEVPDAQKKAQEDSGGQTAEATNAEVDEFFAILERIHVAVKYFKEANEDRRKLAEVRSLESALEVDGSGIEKEEDCVVENAGFDLNADPEPEEDPA